MLVTLKILRVQGEGGQCQVGETKFIIIFPDEGSHLYYILKSPG